jgi:hypothetical protein
MLREFLKKHIKSQASYVELGYGQVEPNHLSAQRTAQIYAQLPADPSIEVLEQGQFVKYDYANGLVNFTGAGEWMLVYNETKLYREHQLDCEFAMVKGNYQARVYSPLDGTEDAEEMYGPTRLLQGVREKWDGSKFVNDAALAADGSSVEAVVDEDGNVTYPGVADFSVAAKTYDYYEMSDVNNSEIEEDYRKRLFMKLRAVKHPEAMMPEGATMVPRVYKTNVGDIFTTNTINATKLAAGDTLKVGAKGILEPGTDDKMTWQVVKVYTMPDHQKGVKIMRIV